MSLLKNIKTPHDIRRWSITKLQALAQEIRDTIINVVSETGGHLAANLGVVELTIALHYVFNTPKDKLIWDVGHQSYPHKLLTGRLKKFTTLRQYKGMSGFPKPEESIYDTFVAGHSSTSISLAAGSAVARDVLKKKHHIISVIGDGSMTAGMAYEALNHIGHMQKNVIVVLNDNTMSIEKNVGAMSNYLNKLITDPKYNRIKDSIDTLLDRIGKRPVAQFGVHVIRRFEEAIKNTVVPGMVFEELGFRYFGPIDGHNLQSMITMLKRIKIIRNRPILLHVITQKGHGLDFAERSPEKYHGVSAFNRENGKQKSIPDKPTYTHIFGKTLITLAKADKMVCAVTPAMLSGSGLVEFNKQFPNRCWDVGIAEQHAITFSAALAKWGLKPACAIYSSFLQRGYDQLIHDVCLQNLPVRFFIDRGGIVGPDGPTHHGVLDLSFLRIIPRLVILSPADGIELQNMIYTALQYTKGPIAVRYPRGTINTDINLERKRFSRIPIGKCEIRTKGKDILLIGFGPLVSLCDAAAVILKQYGIAATVINLRTLKPIDKDTILPLAKKIKKIVTIEDNVIAGGMGSAINELLQKNNISAIVRSLGIPDAFIEQGSIEKIRQSNNMDIPAIVNAAKMVCSQFRKK